MRIGAVARRTGLSARMIRATEPDYDLGTEDRMTLAFDTFLLRARMESYMALSIPPESSRATSVCSR